MHTTFKVKYCHKIFDITEIRIEAEKLLKEALEFYKINYKKIGFDDNHVHCIIDINNYSRPEVAKKLKGYTARKLLQKFPWMKKPKQLGGLFWNSGLWNPSYYMDSVGKDINFMESYVMKQKYAREHFIQNKLISY